MLDNVCWTFKLEKVTTEDPKLGIFWLSSYRLCIRDSKKFSENRLRSSSLYVLHNSEISVAAPLENSILLSFRESLDHISSGLLHQRSCEGKKYHCISHSIVDTAKEKSFN